MISLGMIRYCLLLLLVTLVTAQYSAECDYVDEEYYLTDVGKVEKCFNTLVVDQNVIDLILKNLDVIQDLYPYVDIAKNPPKKPDGYFKKMDYNAGLSDLKKTIAKSNKTFAQVIPPIMAFINGFRDGHFSLSFESTVFFDNTFASVNAFLPFKWEAETNDHYDSRHVYLYNPVSAYLSDEAKEIIEAMYSQHYSVDTIDGVDAFTFLANIFGDYNEMKSPQGRLYVASTSSQPPYGFGLLQYPIDGVFKKHKIVYSDPDHTEVTFNFGFLNMKLASQSKRDEEKLVLGKPFTISQEKEVLEIIRNFKKRTVRSEHQILKCGLYNDMNYIIITSFSYNGMKALQYLQELAECIADFDTNYYPIVIVMQENGGGSAMLEQLTEYMLMPNTDFRTVFAARKTDKTKKVMVDDVQPYFVGVENQFEDGKTCTVMKTKSQLEEFWKYTETDKFGDVSHKRTKKIFMNFVANSQVFSYYKLWNTRKPTDIIVTTEGYCFSACSVFVNNVIRYGAAIVAGYGLTNPGDNLFVAAQCPSSVIDPALYFDELSNNSKYGLTFRTTVTETYNVSSKMDESIPGDYDILRIDKYMKYFDVNDIMTDEFFELVEGVHEEFQTKCNPLNKRLFKVTDECKSSDPNALHTGYACGANGEWDKKTCKIAACKEPYVLDFDKNKCVAASPCDIHYVPTKESSGLNSLSSSSILSPVMNVMVAVFIILFNLVN